MRNLVVYLTKRGGISVKKNSRMSGENQVVPFQKKSDEFLSRKCGGQSESKDVIKYGGTILSSLEESVLSLPPKYAMYEDIDVDEMGLQLRKGGVKMRWSIREEEEQGNEGVSDTELV